MRRMQQLVGLVLVVLITACGSSTTTTVRSPDTVHERWVGAVRDNKREDALALVNPTLGDTTTQSAFVDQTIQYMRGFSSEPSSPTGALERIDIQPTQADGQDSVGISVWHFAKQTRCYRTRMAPAIGGWAVISWSQVSTLR